MKSIAATAAKSKFKTSTDHFDTLERFEVRYIFDVLVSPHSELWSGDFHEKFPEYPRLHTIVCFADDSILQITEDYLENIYTCVLDEGDGKLRTFAEVCGVKNPVSSGWGWMETHSGYGIVEWDCIDDEDAWKRQLDENGECFAENRVMY